MWVGMEGVGEDEWPGERGYREGEAGEPGLGLRNPSCGGWAAEAECRGNGEETAQQESEGRRQCVLMKPDVEKISRRLR